MKQRNRLYGELAHLWPALSPPEDYDYEATLWRDHLLRLMPKVKQKGVPQEKKRILALGIGGGHLVSHFADEFNIDGVDLSPEMMRHARRLLKGSGFFVGDMRNVRLNNVYDAVLLHDAADYLLTEDDIYDTAMTAAAHLEKGGHFLVAPDYVKESFRDGSTSQHQHMYRGDQMTYFEYVWDPDPKDNTIEAVMVFVHRSGRQVKLEEDRHTWGCFPIKVWKSVLREAGVRVTMHPHIGEHGGLGPYLFIGKKA
ncbi:MAG: class I SAM-dependent methyltransferase [Candidatus Hydrogenedentes bacterium]|nr:class I SAM-dependent methyltransferase [Candidatus Hydrogenedentota bacterium]